MTTITEKRGLADICAVQTDPDLPKLNRIVEYIRQLNGDPSHYICGKFAVTERYPNIGPSFEDCLREMMI